MSEPPLPDLESDLVTAIIMSYFSDEAEVRLLLLTLSKSTRVYLKRCQRLLEKWVAPSQMQLINLNAHS